MLRKQLKSGYRKEMYALQLKFICTTVLIVTCLGLSDAAATGQGRRRFGQAKIKMPAEEVKDKPTSTDQTIAATTKNASNKYRRDGTYSSSGDDYIYNSADINFIQPENKPLHSGTKIRAKYSSSITIPYNALEDTETAEEYVAKAVGMYGARFREPIRVSYEPETSSTPAESLKYEQQPQSEQMNFQSEHLQQKYPDEFLPQNAKDEQRISEEQKQINNEYYTYYQKDVRHHTYAPEKEPTQTLKFHQYSSTRPSVGSEQKANTEEHSPNKQREYKAKERSQPEQTNAAKAQVYEKQYEKEYEKAYEKEPMTRSYQIYEEPTEAQEPTQQLMADQKYRPKYVYQPVPQYQEKKEEQVQETGSLQEVANETENEERVRVSAATEIPKAEIMKQIEKSVIKYMKELEAEGKIVTTTQHQEPEEPYFKVETITPSSVKSKSKKPTKYSASERAASEGAQDAAAPVANKKYSKNSQPQEEREEEEAGHVYQAIRPEVDAVLTPNVEFIYKIKTQAPLHTATVKTVSKPYNLALKSYEQFDHSKALKNLQEFDLTHVVTTPDPEESQQTAQHNKLYFNSEIYHDLKTKSHKQKSRKETEYQTEYQPEYENYAASKSQGGYFAEPPADREASSSNVPEDGYPLMNPYQFVSKKEALAKRQEDSFANYEPQTQVKKHNYNPSEYDSYNPKFNNNPEGYGYQQTYKSQLPNRPSAGKRGKRGGSSHAAGGHKKPSQRLAYADLEANVALRPPPKQ